MLWLIGHQLMVGGRACRRWEKRHGSGLRGFGFVPVARDHADRCR